MTSRAHFLVRALDLAPHPEGGWYREMFRSRAAVEPRDGRPARRALTGIYFLLAAGQHGRWHRVESDEAWSWIEGDALRLWTFDVDSGEVRSSLLGPAGEAVEPIRAVPAGQWQAAEPLGEYTLAGCFVGPGFDFADFHLLESDAAARTGLENAAADLLRLL